MEIYAFGSIVRGEIDKYSDTDLLILKEKDEKLSDVDKEQFSIYTYERISSLWDEGNPFSWHLFIESKNVYTSNEVAFISTLGKPNKYENLNNDLDKFYQLFLSSRASIIEDRYSIDFDLSMIFLSIRNFASCFSLGFLEKFEFSRDSAIKIQKNPIQIHENIYNRLKKSRILATRGIGEKITTKELKIITEEFSHIDKWFNEILKLVKNG